MGAKEGLHVMGSSPVELAREHCGCSKLVEISEQAEEAREGEAY